MGVVSLTTSFRNDIHKRYRRLKLVLKVILFQLQNGILTMTLARVSLTRFHKWNK